MKQKVIGIMTTTILVVGILLITDTTLNIQVAEARTHAYNTPCSNGDQEMGGQCCPAGTAELAHSICYGSEGEYQ